MPKQYDLSKLSLSEVLKSESGLDGVLEDVMFDAGRKALEAAANDTPNGTWKQADEVK